MLPLRRALPLLFPLAVPAQTMVFPTPPFFDNTLAHHVASADFDLDGDTDLVVAVLAYHLEFHRNDGEGRFQRDATVYPIPGAFGSFSFGGLAVVDFDLDADADVVIATYQGSPCGVPDYLLRNLGGGTFALSPLTGTNDATMQLVPIDFDNDGDADLLQVNNHGSLFCSPYSSRLLRNAGGTYADVTATLMPAAPFLKRSAAALDLQGDGWIDLVFDGGDVFVNNGTQLQPGPALPVSFSFVRAADLDADGDTDLLGGAGGALGILRNDGAGAFTIVGGPAIPATPLAAVAGDIDGDADLDLVLVIGNAAPLEARLWRHDPGTVFVDVTATQLPSLSVLWPSVSSMWPSVSLLDSDGDGDLDLLAALHGIVHNDGTGTFRRLDSQQTPAAGRALDADGDGDRDVVGFFGSSPNASIGYWRNEDGGRFVRAGTVLVGVYWDWDTNLVTLDYDGDGDDDIFVGQYSERLVRVDAGPVFTETTSVALPPPALPGVSRPVEKAVPGDFDGDGDVDLFLARGAQYPTSPQDALYRNDGLGTFSDVGPSHFVDGGDTHDAVPVDFDGDGDLDLAIVNQPGGVRLFANDGTAHFTDVTATHMPAVAGIELLTVDIESDGDDDLVVGRASQPAMLLRNVGGVYVDASSQLGPHVYSQHPLASDADADGDLDLLLSGDWLMNDGAGGFLTPGVSLGYSPFPRDEHLFADVDRDGDPDWLGYRRNHRRQLVDSLPPRLGLHGELTLHASSSAPGWQDFAFLFLGSPAPVPQPVGGLGYVMLDLATLALHSATTIPPTGAVVRYLCPASPTLLGSATGAQALFLHGPSPADWRLGNLVELRILL
jgi:hypothetical protein